LDGPETFEDASRRAIPNHKSIMLPLLQCLADGKENNIDEVIDALALEFQLSAEEPQQLLGSGQQDEWAAARDAELAVRGWELGGERVAQVLHDPVPDASPAEDAPPLPVPEVVRLQLPDDRFLGAGLAEIVRSFPRAWRSAAYRSAPVWAASSPRLSRRSASSTSCASRVICRWTMDVGAAFRIERERPSGFVRSASMVGLRER